MKILLVEDDPLLSELFVQSLKAHRYTVEHVRDGVIAIEMVSQFSYDLIVLDRLIAKLDGIQVCQRLRERGCQVPILMLTAQDSDEDIIKGLDAGADDYVTKPYQPSHLLARIRALLRRRGNIKADQRLIWGNLCLDPNLVEVTYQKSTVSISPKEYSLLELFLRNPQRIFSRGAIIDHLWSIDESPTDAAVTNMIKDLRRKLKTASMKEEIIETVFRLGYRLKAPPEISQKGESQEAKSVQLIGKDTHLKPENDLIHQIAEEYRTSLKQQVESFEAAVRSHDLLHPAQRAILRDDAHRLAGGLGTVGYPQGSDLAREIEQLLMEDTNLEAVDQTRLFQLLAELEDATRKPPIALPSSSFLSMESTTAVQTDANSFVMLISNDHGVIDTIQQAVLLQRLQLEVLVDALTACDRIDQRTPNLVLLDGASAFQNGNELGLLGELKRRFAAIPVLFLTEQDRFDERVAVTRLGGAGYLLKTAPLETVMQAIVQAIPSTVTSDAKVLLVDDDAMMLKTLTALLQPWGLQVTALSDPGQFWQLLTTVEPDVLLLDLEMPNFNGLDLCRVVRQDARFSDLPILVVTAHREIDTIQSVFAAGADDFISKPVAGPELVTRVLNRIERSRTQQQLVRFQPQPTDPQPQSTLIDSLTQIATIYQFDTVLNDQWSRARQAQTPLSLILGDVDYFKLYNDHNGYPAGDHCLQRLAHTLQAGLASKQELVARYEGETFAILLPGNDLKGALERVERLQRAIAALEIPHPTSPGNKFITLSFGITGTRPIKTNSDDLIAIAKQALYAAKANGRNTYCLYPLFM